jgi:hypothetical protein
VRTLLDWIDRVNAAHPWSHNDHYIPWILRQLPPAAERATVVRRRVFWRYTLVEDAAG